jgi:hypothetical protein
MKVVAFSLWGSHPAYYQGAIENARLIGDRYYSDWQSWFFIGSDAPAHYISELAKFASKLFFVNRSDFSLAFERFSPIFYTNVDIAISRDADSRISDKEYQAVRDWEKTDKVFHAMRDHKLHNFPVMAGMWGVKSNMNDSALNDFREMYNARSLEFESDQVYFADFYKKHKDLFLEHDDRRRYGGVSFPEYKNFDVGSYIGQRIDEGNNPASDLRGFSGEGY